MVHFFNSKLEPLQGVANDHPLARSFLTLLDHLQFHLQVWHQATEDIIFEVLIQKELPDAQLLANTMEEHGVLESLLTGLYHYLDRVGIDTDASSGQFVENSRNFIGRQLNHMKLEGDSLFPLADDYLQEADWIEIKGRLEGTYDPLKGPKLLEFDAFYLSLSGSKQ